MDNIDCIQFSSRLRMAIEKKGITQIDLAKQVGISKTALNNYAQGKLPTVPILYAISTNLSVSLEWLLSGNHSKTVQSLDEMEQRLLEMYRELDNRDRQDIWETTLLKLNRTLKKDMSQDTNSGNTA